MPVETCEEINAWIPWDIRLTTTGGEFSVLDNYPEMLVALARDRKCIRLITNGFWSHKDKRIKRFFNTIKQIQKVCKRIEIGVSNDGFHKWDNYYAHRLIRHNGLGIHLIPMARLTVDDIAPIGRAWNNKISSRRADHCYCKSTWSLAVIEDGMICRCPYGYFPWKHFSETTWYDAQRHVWDWRERQLALGMNCHMCMETVEADRYRKLHKTPPTNDA